MCTVCSPEATQANRMVQAAVTGPFDIIFRQEKTCNIKIACNMLKRVIFQILNATHTDV